MELPLKQMETLDHKNYSRCLKFAVSKKLEFVRHIDHVLAESLAAELCILYMIIMSFSAEKETKRYQCDILLIVIKIAL